MLKLSDVLILWMNINALKEWSHENTEIWKTQFPQCNGKSQSPISINTRTVIRRNISETVFQNYFKNIPGSLVVLKNNGHKVSLSLAKVPTQNRPRVNFKGESYICDEIHFHWPSDHAINNVKTSLEVHLVHRNRKYKSVAEAAGLVNGITVVSTLYKVSKKKENSLLSGISKDLYKIIKPHSESSLSKDLKIGEIFPLKTPFINYVGSFTTPKCNENVNWIVYAKYRYVSRKEVSSNLVY